MNNIDKQAERLIGHLEVACLLAAKHIVLAASSKRKIAQTIKPDGSIVLELDLECQQIIMRELKNLLPLVGEEDLESHTIISNSNEYILIDPIDGTSACKRFLTVRGGQVGFGPLIGWAKNGQVQAAVFYHVPDRSLYTAVRDQGCCKLQCDPHISSLPEREKRKRLKVKLPDTLRQCGVLFYPSPQGEGEIVDYLKAKNIIEVPFRFGCFANDAVRLAQGLEQIQIQFKVKAWDATALLFEKETGYKIIFDPMGEAVSFDEWHLTLENPVTVAPPALMDELLVRMAEARQHVSR